MQLGEGSKDKDEKPKRSIVPKGVDANAVDLEYALQLLSLPRPIGNHPETGKPITAGLGRYGPFILHDGTYANLPTVEEVFSVGINRAVVLLAEKKAGGGKGRFQRAAPTVLKELGDHPSEGGKVQVLSGRYGPYVKHGDVNATLPRGKEPAALTMDEAVQLIAERVGQGPLQAQGPPRQERQGQRRRRGAREGQEGGEGSRRGQGQIQGQRQGVRHARGRGVGTKARWPANPKKPARPGLPSKEDILEYVRGAGVKAGKREIARAFAVKGGDRVALKQRLAEMADEGLLSGNRKGFKERGKLPPVAVLEIVARDADGELVGRAGGVGPRGRRAPARAGAGRPRLGPRRRSGARPGRPHPGAADAAR